MAVAGGIVALLAVVATAPWWAAHSGSRRRARGGSDVAGAPAAGAAPDDPTAVELPVLLELLAAAMRAGAGVPRALEATADSLDGAAAVPGADPAGGPDGRALRAAARALRLGADWDAAWRGAPPRLGALHRALRGAWVDGAASSDALRAARDEVLHDRRAAARTAAARLGVRLVLPLGACFLPAFVLVGLAPVLIAFGVDLLSG
ncbi:type II secretion system F family protein [Isoptericola hypogeus]|uniref:type II secretion system F family protein n=1 Tax=Isoptericola hypogeus TaxID=300179 RepID=UPI0031CF8EE1